MAEPDLERALVAVAEHFRAALDLDAVSIEADADILPHPAIAARDDAARADLRATGSELRLMDPAGPSRTIRLVGPTTARAGRRARLVPIVAAGARVGRLTVLPRAGAAEFGPAEERVFAIAAAQLGLTIERARFRQEATESEVLRRAAADRARLCGDAAGPLESGGKRRDVLSGGLRDRDQRRSRRLECSLRCPRSRAGDRARRL